MVSYDISKLIAERMRKGWTKAHLARIIGVDKAIIGRVERGTNQSPETVKKMADALHVRMRDLVIVESEATAS